MKRQSNVNGALIRLSTKKQVLGVFVLPAIHTFQTEHVFNVHLPNIGTTKIGLVRDALIHLPMIRRNNNAYVQQNNHMFFRVDAYPATNLFIGILKLNSVFHARLPFSTIIKLVDAYVNLLSLI